MAAQNDIIPTGSAGQPQVGSLLGGRYRLQEAVANATIGMVFKGADQKVADEALDESRVAIRVFTPELAEQKSELRALQREVARIRCLAHPHIARFIDFNHDGACHYLVVEWLDGRTLAGILDSAEARYIDRVYAFRIVRQLGEALDYAHRCGIVHGGLDPANVMIMPNGDARIFDFGLAGFQQRLLAGRAESHGPVAGTMAYSSLQVLKGETPVNSDDVFSLACLLYRLIAGHRVFGPRNAADAFQAEMVPQRPQGFTDTQWIAISRALMFSRDVRYQDVSEFVAALENARSLSRSNKVVERRSVAAVSKSYPWIIAAVTGMALLAGVTVKPGLVETDRKDLVTTAALLQTPASAPQSAIAKQPAIDVPVSTDSPKTVGTKDEGATIQPAAVPKTAAKPALPLNAIGFSADRALVYESDPAVQIDVMRFNADDRSLSIRYTVESLSATEGEDYFAPGSLLLSFGPRQRTARLLVPLVQDAVIEGEERFVLRLSNTPEAPSVYGYQEILVTIRDDDPQAP